MTAACDMCRRLCDDMSSACLGYSCQPGVVGGGPVVATAPEQQGQLLSVGRTQYSIWGDPPTETARDWDAGYSREGRHSKYGRDRRLGKSFPDPSTASSS